MVKFSEKIQNFIDKYPFFASTIAGGVGEWAYILLTIYTDTILPLNYSTLVGLIVEGIIEFFMQLYVFRKEGYIFSKYYVWRFFIAKIGEIAINQELFMRINDWIHDKYNDFYNNEYKKWAVYIIRWIIGFIVTILYNWPVKKCFVFSATKMKRRRKKKMI